MRVTRVSIAGLMALVLASGLGLAALVSRSSLWASVTFTVALSALLVATLGAALRGRHRTFWLGFAVFGWGYAIFSFAPGAEVQIRPYLLTSLVLDALSPFLGLTLGGAYSGGRFYGYSAQYVIYQRVGHSLAILVHGLAGAALAVIWAAYEGPDDRRPG